MTTRKRKLRVADLFCGAGGFTAALLRALEEAGIDVELVCVNHWQTAIDTHRANHPRARHYVTDLHTADPEKLVPEGYLDLLLASPTCTYHSRARGGKPTSDQQRMDPFVILTWCTKLRVRRLIVENVPEFRDWGPVFTTGRRKGKPIPSRKGEYFRSWVKALEAIGYKFEDRILTAADYGDATTRKRFFAMSRNDRKPITWPAPSHSKDGVPDLFGNGAEKWRAAREIINWNDKGRSIFWRPRRGRHDPLKPNTLKRVLAGAIRFAGPWADVFQTVIEEELYRSIVYTQTCEWEEVVVGKNGKRRTKRVLAKDGVRVPRLDRDLRFVTRGGKVIRDEADLSSLDVGRLDVAAHLIVMRGTGSARSADTPVPAITAQGNHLGLVQPYVFQVNQSSGRYGSIRGADDPLYTILTRDGLGVAVPEIAAAFTCGNRTNNTPKSIDVPIGTNTTVHGGGIFLVRPGVFLLAQGSNGAPQVVDHEPVPTITTISRIQLIEPSVVPFVIGQHGGSVARDTAEPLPTIACDGAISLLQPFIVNRHSHYGNDVRARTVDHPTPTATGSGGGYLVEPFLLAVNHGGHDPRIMSTHMPVPTITGKRGMALGFPHAFLAPYYANGDALIRSVDLPVPTLTTKGRIGLVQPELFPFLVPQFGERPGQQPRFHAIDRPLPAVTGHGAGALVKPWLTQIDQAGSGGACVRSVFDPVSTVITKQNVARVEPYIVCPRHSREGAGPRPRSVNEPIPSITAGGSQFAVVAAMTPADGAAHERTGRLVYVDGVPFMIDILFRMLRNPELAAAMSFTEGEYSYEFTGTETEITKQIGNAVPVRTARALVRASLSDLIPSVEKPKPEVVAA